MTDQRPLPQATVEALTADGWWLVFTTRVPDDLAIERFRKRCGCEPEYLLWDVERKELWVGPDTPDTERPEDMVAGT